MKRIALLLVLWGLLTILSAQLLTQGFEGEWPPAGWLIFNAGTGNVWTQMTSDTECYEGTHCMVYQYHNSQAANTWAFSAGIPMIEGRTYRVEFEQIVLNSSYPEYMKLTIGTAQTVATQTTTLLDYPLPGLTNNTYINRIAPEYVCPATGIYYIGFKCYSKRDMYFLCIDDVKVYETIPNAVPDEANCVAPANEQTNVMVDAPLKWSPRSGNVDSYRLFLGTDYPPTNVINFQYTENETYQPPTLEYNTTYYWQVKPQNEIGLAENCPIWSFTTGANPTISSFPYSESFDAFIPSYGWHSAPVNGTWNWMYKTETIYSPNYPAHSGAGMACYDVSESSTGNSAMLVSPPITADPDGYTYSLSLWMIRELVNAGTTDRINLYYATQPNLNNSPTLLQTFHRSVYLDPSCEQIAGWHELTQGNLPFLPGTQNYIIIEAVDGGGSSIYVDDLTILCASRPSISVYPYSIDFATFLPADWYLDGVGSANWSQNNVANAWGTAPEAKLSYTPQFIGTSRMVSPLLNTSSISSLQLSFRTKYDHYSGAFEIGVATRHAFGEWHTVWSRANSSLMPTQIFLTIENEDIGETNTQVCFYASGDSYNINNWYLDDFLFDSGDLQPPENVQLSLGVDGLLLEWDGVSGATGYNVWSSETPDAAFDPEAQINWQKLNIEPLISASMVIQPLPSTQFYRVTACK
ncbi:MAG: hypothetical protein RBS43_04235 [Candidatus Cloacimonas sp.]|jgi:hypothetical protein|nr:hypothetical protein [Candidatus Cloacimonas sp.]